MKKAHEYNLKVVWETGHKWDFNILAITAEAVTMWLPKDEKGDCITSVNVTLVKMNAVSVKDNFLAKAITE